MSFATAQHFDYQGHCVVLDYEADHRSVLAVPLGQLGERMSRIAAGVWRKPAGQVEAYIARGGREEDEETAVFPAVDEAATWLAPRALTMLAGRFGGAAPQEMGP